MMRHLSFALFLWTTTPLLLSAQRYVNTPRPTPSPPPCLCQGSSRSFANCHGLLPCFTTLNVACVTCVASEHFVLRDCGCSFQQPYCVMANGDRVEGKTGVKCVKELLENEVESGHEEDEAPSNDDYRDLGIRFNKFGRYHKNSTVALPKLTAPDFPLQGATAEVLREHSNAVSVTLDNEFELQSMEMTSYIKAMGGRPTMPGEIGFWNDLEEVIDMQLLRLQGGDPAELTVWPKHWKDLSMTDIAEAVHDEYPGSLQSEYFTKLWKAKVPIDYDVLPKRCNNDFIGDQIRVVDLNTWAIRVVSPFSFCIKWAIGRPRPEEIAWQIAIGNLTSRKDRFPDRLTTKILSLQAMEPNALTAYREGCPRHPSWPAMHSAASSASLWLSVVYDLTQEQRCEALRVDYAVSLARSVAGVHYTSDNIAGLNLGQEVVARELPSFLAETYGSNATVVANKIRKFRFDWATFNATDCSYDDWIE